MRNPINEDLAVGDDYYSGGFRRSRTIADNTAIPSRPVFLGQLGGVATRTARVVTLHTPKGYQGDLPLEAQPQIRKPYPWD